MDAAVEDFIEVSSAAVVRQGERVGSVVLHLEPLKAVVLRTAAHVHLVGTAIDRLNLLIDAVEDELVEREVARGTAGEANRLLAVRWSDGNDLARIACDRNGIGPGRTARHSIGFGVDDVARAGIEA